MAAPQPKTLEIPNKIDDIWPPVELSKGGHTVRVFRTVNKDNYKFFTIAYYEHGKRQRKCVSKEATALSEARNTLKRLVAGESEAAAMRLSDVRAYENAKRLVAPTGLSLEAACKELADCIALLQGQCSLRDAVLETLQRRRSVVEIKTVADVVAEFIKLKRAGLPTRAGGKVEKLSEKYVNQMDMNLERFTAGVAGQIKDITADQINRWVGELKPRRKGKETEDEPMTGRTRNNYLADIRCVWEYAKWRKYIPRDSEVAEHLSPWEEDDYAIEIFTAEEIKRLLAHASSTLIPALTIGAFAGVRNAEIVRLDWSDIDLTQKYIHIQAWKAKTGQERFVPITPNLFEWLNSCETRTGPVWPFTPNYLSDSLCRLGDRAGTEWKHNAPRHSYISYRVAMEKRPNEVACDAGNSVSIINKHYRKPVLPDRGQEWFAVTPAVVEQFKAKLEQERTAKIVELSAVAA